MPRSTTTARPAITTRDGDGKAKGKRSGSEMRARTSASFALDAALIGLIAELRTSGRASRSTRERLAGEFADEVMNTARELAAGNARDVAPFFEAVRSAAVEIPNAIQSLITAECQAERNLLARVVRAVSKS